MLKFGLNFYSNVTCGILKKHFWHQNKLKNNLFSAYDIKRSTSFFNKASFNELWKSATSVSNAGKKKGRGKFSDLQKKLNIVKTPMGAGNANIFWPGLSGNIIESQTLQNIHKMNAKPTIDNQIKQDYFKGKLHPLLRGWSGKSTKGRLLGPPDPKFDLSFENFNSIVIESRMTGLMTGNLGRKKGFRVTVLVGNGKGLIGVSTGHGSSIQIALRKAKNKAINKLIAINFEDSNTVNHDFFYQFGNTKVFVFKKPKGHGLVCHRALNACCTLLGIKDIAAKVEGASSNVKHIVKAFLLGLLYKQKTFQQIADETRLHVVEIKKETLDYPEVLASPKVCLEPCEVNETHNFDQYVMGGKIYFRKKKKFQQSTKKITPYKNSEEVRLNILEEYGKFRSFLADIYPECEVKSNYKKKEK